jgi:hypothetical protein
MMSLNSRRTNGAGSLISSPFIRLFLVLLTFVCIIVFYSNYRTLLSDLQQSNAIAEVCNQRKDSLAAQLQGIRIVNEA